jgi:Tetratricopeptide repeat
MVNLALTYWYQGQWKEAEELEVQVMETRKRVLGQEHPDTLISMNNLPWTLKCQICTGEALPLMTECIQLSMERLGENHPNFAQGLVSD